MSLSASEILSKESSIIRQPTPRSLKRSKSSSCTLEKEIKRGTVSDMSCSYTDRTGSGCCNLWTQAEYGCSRFGSRESYGVIRVMRVIRVTAFNPLCGRSLAILMQLMMLIHVDMLTCWHILQTCLYKLIFSLHSSSFLATAIGFSFDRRSGLSARARILVSQDACAHRDAALIRRFDAPRPFKAWHQQRSKATWAILGPLFHFVDMPFQSRHTGTVWIWKGTSGLLLICR